MAASATAQPLSGGSDDTVGDSAKFGVVTICDRASSGVYQDLSGPAILGFFSEAIKSRWQVVLSSTQEPPTQSCSCLQMASCLQGHS